MSWTTEEQLQAQIEEYQTMMGHMERHWRDMTKIHGSMWERVKHLQAQLNRMQGVMEPVSMPAVAPLPLAKEDYPRLAATIAFWEGQTGAPGINAGASAHAGSNKGESGIEEGASAGGSNESKSGITEGDSGINGEITREVCDDDDDTGSGADTGATKQRKLAVKAVRPTLVSVKMDRECTSAKDFRILCEHDPFLVDWVKKGARKHFRESGAIGQVPCGVKPGDCLKVASTGEKWDFNSWIGSQNHHEQVNQEFLDGNDLWYYCLCIDSVTHSI